MIVRQALPAVAALLALLAGCGGDGMHEAGGTAPAPLAAPAPIASPPASLPVRGAIQPVHDPAIIREGGTYYLFTTGHLADAEGVVPMRSSSDLRTWRIHGPVFPELPAWAADTIPGTRGLWAPDISRTTGEFRLYYSVSTFGSNRSAIGLATNARLDPAAPAAGWTDKGVVFQSQEADDYNAIDPNIITDAKGRQWMSFGSFWSGIKMFELDPATGMRLSGDTALHSLAARPDPGAIEAPFIIRRGEYYHLFVSFDFCCRGAQSTYRTLVGRSREVTGPYVDREGRPMLEGGGTQVLGSGQDIGSRYVGRGHVAILQDDARDYIVYHAYDTQLSGAPTLRIRPISWSADGWPTAE